MYSVDFIEDQTDSECNQQEQYSNIRHYYTDRYQDDTDIGVVQVTYTISRSNTSCFYQHSCCQTDVRNNYKNYPAITATTITPLYRIYLADVMVVAAGGVGAMVTLVVLKIIAGNVKSKYLSSFLMYRKSYSNFYPSKTNLCKPTLIL